MAMDILIAIETLEVKETYKAKNTLKAIETFDSKKSITQSKKSFINLTQSVKSLILEMLSHLKRRNSPHSKYMLLYWFLPYSQLDIVS